MDQSRHIVLAIDVEAASRNLFRERCLMSVGLVCAEFTHGRLTLNRERRVVLDWSAQGGLVFDASTHAFWQGYPEALRLSTTNGVAPDIAAQEIVAFISDVEELSQKTNRPLVVVTDNAAFDVAWVDWLIKNHGPEGAPDLRTQPNGEYRHHTHFVDITQHMHAALFMRTLISLTNCPRPLPTGIKHEPVSDARRTVEEYACYLRRTFNVRMSRGTD